jgi:hypothetical protein
MHSPHSLQAHLVNAQSFTTNAILEVSLPAFPMRVGGIIATQPRSASLSLIGTSAQTKQPCKVDASRAPSLELAPSYSSSNCLYLPIHQFIRAYIPTSHPNHTNFIKPTNQPKQHPQPSPCSASPPPLPAPLPASPPAPSHRYSLCANPSLTPPRRYQRSWSRPLLPKAPN